jgi:thioesterase domain-containing protein
VAFELARVLEARQPVIRVVLIDCATRSRGPRESGGLETWLSSFEPAERERLSRRIEPFRRLADLYEPGGCIRSDLVAVEATENAVPARMEEWCPLTSGAFTHVFAPGDHFTVLYPRHLDAMANLLRRVSDFSVRTSAVEA